MRVRLVVDLHKIMTNVEMVELIQSSRLHREAARLPGLLTRHRSLVYFLISLCVDVMILVFDA